MALFIPVEGPIECVQRINTEYKFDVPTKVFPRWCTIDLVAGKSGKTYSYDVIVEDNPLEVIPRPNWRASLVAHPLLITKYGAYLSGNVVIVPRSNNVHYTLEDFLDIYTGVIVLEDSSNLELVTSNIASTEETKDIINRAKRTLELPNCPAGFSMFELRDLCKKRGLACRGTKKMLCERLLEVVL